MTRSLQHGPERDQVRLFYRKGTGENTKIGDGSAMEVAASVAAQPEGSTCPDVARELRALVPTLSRNGFAVQIESYARWFHVPTFNCWAKPAATWIDLPSSPTNRSASTRPLRSTSHPRLLSSGSS